MDSGNSEADDEAGEEGSGHPSPRDEESDLCRSAGGRLKQANVLVRSANAFSGALEEAITKRESGDTVPAMPHDSHPLDDSTRATGAHDALFDDKTEGEPTARGVLSDEPAAANSNDAAQSSAPGADPLENVPTVRKLDDNEPSVTVPTDAGSNVTLDAASAAQDALLDSDRQHKQKNRAASPAVNIDTATTTAGNAAAVEKLQRELALSRTHRLERQAHWRRVLRKEKFSELHGEIPRLIKYHNQGVARKKEVIEAIHDEIRSLQELYRDATVANMHRMEDLMALHDEQVVKLERRFRDKVSALQYRFRSDIEHSDAQYEKEKEEVRQCIQRQAEKDSRQSKELRQEHLRELEEMKNRHLEHTNSLRFVMDSKVEELKEQLERTRGDFARKTDDARAAHDLLNAKEDRRRAEIESKTRQANALQREIQSLRLIAKQDEAQIAERHGELRARKARAIARWNRTQEAITRFRDEQQTRLVDLIRRANEWKEGLGKQCALAERVTKIAVACRRLESSREEYASLLRKSSCPAAATEEQEEGPGEETEGGEGRHQSSSEDGSEQTRSFIVGCMGRLGDTTHRFWNKYNMAKLDVLVMEKQVRSLKEQEQELKQKLKMYHDGITVNDDVLKERNPLFVINGKMNAMPHAAPGKKRRKKRLTVVDGNQFIANRTIAKAI